MSFKYGVTCAAFILFIPAALLARWRTDGWLQEVFAVVTLLADIVMLAIAYQRQMAEQKLSRYKPPSSPPASKPDEYNQQLAALIQHNLSPTSPQVPDREVEQRLRNYIQHRDATELWAALIPTMLLMSYLGSAQERTLYLGACAGVAVSAVVFMVLFVRSNDQGERQIRRREALTKEGDGANWVECGKAATQWERLRETPSERDDRLRRDGAALLDQEERLRELASPAVLRPTDLAEYLYDNHGSLVWDYLERSRPTTGGRRGVLKSRIQRLKTLLDAWASSIHKDVEDAKRLRKPETPQSPSPAVAPPATTAEYYDRPLRPKDGSPDGGYPTGEKTVG